MTEIDPASDQPPEEREAESSTASSQPERDSAWRRWKHRTALTLILLVGGGLSLYLAWQVVTWPEVEELAHRNPETTAFIERYRARNEGRKPEWVWVRYERISPYLKQAVLVAEDINFFSHKGFALDEMKIALEEMLAGERELRGASTITQQLAKNLWLSPSRDPLRKAKEAVLTRQLERKLSKQRILELYLNVVEFGPGVYGAEAAARRFFDESAAELDEMQSAQLAAALPRPSRWHPRSDSESYRRYVADIRNRMERARFLWRRIGPAGSGARSAPAAGAAVAPGAPAAEIDSLMTLAADTLAAGKDTLPDPGLDSANAPPDSVAVVRDSTDSRADTLPRPPSATRDPA